MGNSTIISSRNGIEIVELVQEGLGIVLTVGCPLIRPICENDGNSDTWWISGRTVLHERSRRAPGLTLSGNDVPCDSEDIIERRWRVGITGRKFRSRRRD